MKTGLRFRALAEDLALELERGKYFYLAIFSIVFIGLTSLRALAKPLWYDELFTYYMSRLPGIRTIWSALKDGADLNPPLLYLATSAAHRMFGDGLLATRLPAILGFLTMLVCLFVFVSRRCGASYGFAAMLLAALSGAYTFSYEARSYGMVLGFCGISLITWQAAADRRRRFWALAGLGLSVGAALLTHCYAVLILLPLAAGEITRSFTRKRLDWHVWIALIFGSCTAGVYLPLLAASHRLALDNVTFRPTLRVLIECYGMLIGPLAGPVLLALAVVVVSRSSGGESPAGRPILQGFKFYEIVAALTLVFIPVVALLIAIFVSHVFMPRYGLAAVIGFSILFAWFAREYTADRRITGAVVSYLFAFWFIGGFALWMMGTAHLKAAASSHAGPPAAYEIPLELVKPDLPFVAANGLFFLEADHYAPPSFVSRLVYLADTASAVRYTGSDVFDRGFPTMQKWFPIRAHVESYATFTRQHRRFLVFGSFDHPLAWVTRKLLDDGVELRFLGQYPGAYGENLLLEAIMPDAGTQFDAGARSRNRLLGLGVDSKQVLPVTSPALSMRESR
jgi:hypothetical protein